MQKNLLSVKQRDENVADAFWKLAPKVQRVRLYTSFDKEFKMFIIARSEN